MAGTIGDTFQTCRREQRAAFMPFLTAGFPSERSFMQLMRAIIQAGADMIEIGVPFSDPLADGPSIQKSSEAALKNGIDIDRALYLARKAADKAPVPLILMSYFNPILAFGPQRLMSRMKQSNFSGLIIPDLVPEEGRDMERLCCGHGIKLIYLLAPTSDNERRRLIINRTSGFVYLVAVTGVTGARQTLPRNLIDWIRKVKRESPQPVCVGFGVSNDRQAREISRVSDGVIVGSALVEFIEQAPDRKKMIEDIISFVSSIKRQLGRNHRPANK